ncbi:hypothetical protein LCGC14_0663170 [marine sediment metagenome]|uniref:Helicase ATP-binding domain-containing protein n=1 Tax=marine sediment metagenome TaxID=412755 RepID=A0A0F9QY34_9ZZZZ
MILSRPVCLNNDLPDKVLLCPSHALETAPAGKVRDRYEKMCAYPGHDLNGVVRAEGLELTPSDYQLKGALFMAQRWACLLSDTKGLGKTGEALLAIPEGVGTVVVCPASCKPGWYDETLVWRPDLRPQVLNGRSAWKAGPIAGQVYIMNYDILPTRLQRCRCHHLKEEHPNGDELLAGVEAGTIPRDHPGGACLNSKCRCTRYRWSPLLTSELRDNLSITIPTILIADEVHHVKRGASEKTKRFRELRRACDRAWGMSASPLENNERELQGVYESLGIFGAAFGTPKKFHALFKNSRENARAPSGPSRDEIRDRRSWVELGRTAEQVGLELPPLRFEERRVILKASDLAEVERLMSEAIATKRTWDRVKAGELADPSAPDATPAAARAFERERELALLVSHTDDDVIDAIKRVIELGPRAKIGPEMSRLRKALAAFKLPTIIGSFVEEVETSGTPGVLFSAHRMPIETVGARDGWGEISGRVPPRKRKRVLAAWKAGDLIGLAGTIRACGEGLNLHQCGKKMCALAAFADLDWTPEKNNQAAKRIHRRGQTLACLVTSYVADHPVDRHVARIINVKQRLIDAITITGGI